MQVHKVAVTPPSDQRYAATLALDETRLYIIRTGAVEALDHFPVIRNTPNLRVTPDLVDEYKEKEAWFSLFPLTEILTWAEHTTLPLDEINAVQLDTGDLPTVQISTAEAAYTFALRLTDEKTLKALVQRLKSS